MHVTSIAGLVHIPGNGFYRFHICVQDIEIIRIAKINESDAIALLHYAIDNEIKK